MLGGFALLAAYRTTRAYRLLAASGQLEQELLLLDLLEKSEDRLQSAFSFSSRVYLISTQAQMSLKRKRKNLTQGLL